MIPNVAELAHHTIDLLREECPQASRAMRRLLACQFGLAPAGAEWPHFVNNHAWALVKLQADGIIKKMAPGVYMLLPGGKPTTPETGTTPIVVDAPLPGWAGNMVAVTRRRNLIRWGGGDFTHADLRMLWQRCGGRCAMTGLSFLETQIGTGRARKPFAPSLDRIDPEQPYSRDNCRLVCVSVNFALNAFGDDVFLKMAKAAVSFEAVNAKCAFMPPVPSPSRVPRRNTRST